MVAVACVQSMQQVMPCLQRGDVMDSQQAAGASWGRAGRWCSSQALQRTWQLGQGSLGHARVRFDEAVGRGHGGGWRRGQALRGLAAQADGAALHAQASAR